MNDMDGPPADPPLRRRRSRRRRILKITAISLGVLLVVAGGIAYWALDRFVIDHVEVEDVRAFEAAALASTIPRSTAPRSTAAVTDPAAPPAESASANDADASPAASPSSPANTSTTTEPPTTVPPTTEPTPRITDSSFQDADVTLTIERVDAGTPAEPLVYYVADVILRDATRLRAGLAENKFGRNIIANTSTIAKENDAVFAINGDYYGFRSSGIVIRNGVLFRDDGARDALAIYADGRMAIVDEKATTGQELLDAGVIDTLSFGPALLVDGRIPDGIEDVEVDTNFGNRTIQGKQPRTGVGMVAPGHYVFVVADGRAKQYSNGVTMTEFATIFQNLGATVAYNLDGGGSATMWFNGALVNNPRGNGKERGTSDILYIAAS